MSATDICKANLIRGYENIARATGRAINTSVSVRTAKRWAKEGRDNRLPVYPLPNGRAALLEEDLAVWARAWLAVRPKKRVRP